MAAPDFEIRRVWKAVNEALASAAISFWTGNKALSAERARERVPELAAVAYSAAGDVIGVATAVIRWIPTLELPCFYFRMFVAPRHRSQHLARELLAETVRTLAMDEEVKSPEGPKGVLLEMHNPKIPRAIRDLIWRVREFEFVYIGYSATQHQMRIFYFPDRRLPRDSSRP